LHEEDRYKIIKHFHILGGEPLLQHELDTTIDFWEGHPNSGLTINLITNLTLPHDKFVEKINRFKTLVDKKCIYELQLTASLDCWGDPQEYVRNGINLIEWEKNFNYLLDKEWIFLSINSCVTSLTIKTLPDLIKKIDKWNNLRPSNKRIHWSFNLPIGEIPYKSGQHPKSIGYEHFKEELDSVLSLLPETTHDEKSSKEHFAGIVNSLKQYKPDPEKIAVLKSYLSELDKRRNTDWKTTFPWLELL
jgi:hypothetical protein